MLNLVGKAQNTLFGSEHSFEKIRTYADFVNFVPIRDYEGLNRILSKLLTEKKIFFGPANLFIFAKLLAQPLAKNIFLLALKACQII